MSNAEAFCDNVCEYQGFGLWLFSGLVIRYLYSMAPVWLQHPESEETEKAKNDPIRAVRDSKSFYFLRQLRLRAELLNKIG